MRLQWPQINHKMRVTMKDGRQLVGQMLAFDKVWTRTQSSSKALPAN